MAFGSDASGNFPSGGLPGGIFSGALGGATTGSFLGPVGAAVGALGGAGVSLYNQWKYNKTATELSDKDWDRNLALTRESWLRDDSKYSRLVKDLKNSGINPMLAAGGATASQSSPAAVSSGGSRYSARAPQLDTSSIMDVIRTFMDYDLRKESNKTQQFEADTGRLSSDRSFDLGSSANSINVTKAENDFFLRSRELALQELGLKNSTNLTNAQVGELNSRTVLNSIHSSHLPDKYRIDFRNALEDSLLKQKLADMSDAQLRRFDLELNRDIENGVFDPSLLGSAGAKRAGAIADSLLNKAAVILGIAVGAKTLKPSTMGPIGFGH